MQQTNELLNTKDNMTKDQEKRFDNAWFGIYHNPTKATADKEGYLEFKDDYQEVSQEVKQFIKDLLTELEEYGEERRKLLTKLVEKHEYEIDIHRLDELDQYQSHIKKMKEKHG